MSGFIDMGPLIVGAIGGSGTRVVAQALRSTGVFFGDDLNEPLDNLTAAFLLNRRQLLLDRDLVPQALRILEQYMTTETPFSPADIEFLNQTACAENQQHDQNFLRGRLDHLVQPRKVRRAAHWGWKMPPSHIFLPEILRWKGDAKYLHVRRHPLDMAFSRNLNQLRMWGPIMLGRSIEEGPDDQLKYWIAAEHRIAKLGETFPERISILSFERLCSEPETSLGNVFDFFSIELDTASLSRLAAAVSIPASAGRRNSHNIEILDPASLDAISQLGYNP